MPLYAIFYKDNILLKDHARNHSAYIYAKIGGAKSALSWLKRKATDPENYKIVVYEEVKGYVPMATVQ